MRKRFGRWLTPLLVAVMLGLGLAAPNFFRMPGPQARMWRPSPVSLYWHKGPQAMYYRPAPQAWYWRP